MAASPLTLTTNPLADKNYPRSPVQLDPIGSPNQLIQPRIDAEPNQPLFNKSEFGKSELLKNISNANSIGDESYLLQTAMRMKDQNTKLKSQLKELKQTLKDTLGKVQSKNREKEKVNDPSELNKELEGHQKQIGVFKKEIQALRNRLEGLNNQDKVVRMENLLKDKNRQIDEGMQEKRNLEKIKSTQDEELERLQKEYGYEKRIQTFNEEAKNTREKIAKIRTVNRTNEQKLKDQQEYLVVITNQYRMVCDKLGISPSLNFTRAEELTNLIVQKQKDEQEKQKEIASFKAAAVSSKKGSSIRPKARTPKNLSTKEKEVNDSKDLKPQLEVTPATVAKLEASIESLKSSTETLEQGYTKQIAATQVQKQEALNKLKELEARLKDKEKEASILSHRAQELKRIVRFNALRPLNGDKE